MTLHLAWGVGVVRADPLWPVDGRGLSHPPSGQGTKFPEPLGLLGVDEGQACVQLHQC